VRLVFKYIYIDFKTREYIFDTYESSDGYVERQRKIESGIITDEVEVKPDISYYNSTFNIKNCVKKDLIEGTTYTVLYSKYYPKSMETNKCFKLNTIKLGKGNSVAPSVKKNLEHIYGNVILFHSSILEKFKIIYSSIFDVINTSKFELEDSKQREQFREFREIESEKRIKAMRLLMEQKRCEDDVKAISKSMDSYNELQLNKVGFVQNMTESMVEIYKHGKKAERRLSKIETEYKKPLTAEEIEIVSKCKLNDKDA
jgi:hypothetical protein